MKQLTLYARPRRLLSILSLLAALACQGRGRVLEAPPASYPDEPPAGGLESPAHEPATNPLPAGESRASESRGDEASAEQGASAAPPAVTPWNAPESSGSSEWERSSAAPEAKARNWASLGRGDAHDAAPGAWDDAGSRPLAPRESPERRPGLATHWGETRYSPARQVDFERRDATRPSASLELHYNDRSGARRMLPNGRWRRAEAYALGGLHVRIVDEAGRTLPALTNGTRVIGVGTPGERYAISIENPTGARFEVVASVDGLDVLDGEDASFEKRGYLVGAYSSVSIDGFRQSDADVAAFRLGDVARSYAARQGKSRNVGVIGFALFEERRPVAYEAPTWRAPRPRDTDLRRDADPFPGRYARPPVW
jgi:hypothetical protein